MKYTILITLTLLSLYINANEDQCCLQKLIYPQETIEELQMNPQTSVETLLNEFTAKGGTLIRLENDSAPFVFQPGDHVFPACSGGNNRSQTLWNMLRSFSDKIRVLAPHATQYGFDPYNGQAAWLNIKLPQEYDEFFLWAGVEKSPKLGWDIFSDWLNKPNATLDELQTMWNFYTEHYYHPNIAEKTRRIYITFAKNAHIHLYRLNQTNTTLENVFVLFFPIEDLIKHPPAEWNTFSGSVKAYVELASYMSVYLDFEKLN